MMFDFSDFWARYPRKVGKVAALREWSRIKPNDDLIRTMLLALDAQKRSRQWLKDGGEYIPHARTWLHQERWTDEAESAGVVTGSAPAYAGPWCRHLPKCGTVELHALKLSKGIAEVEDE